MQFCTDKIEQNFSNYSSWHYRSKLLPLLYPNEDETRKGWPIDEKKLKSELELVLTAAFTDPKDSSAWFYQRWLLGYSDNNQEIVSAFVSKEKAILSFSKAINLQDCTLDTGIDRLNETALWKSTNGLNTDLIWFATSSESPFELPNGETMKISIKSDSDNLTISTTRKGEAFFALAQDTSFTGTLGQPIIDELKSQLDSCEQLLEFEPESKWTLLTSALLMRAIDREAYHEQTIENLEKLKTVDSYRLGYYADLISKWNIERSLLKWLKAGDYEAAVDFSSCSPDLTCLYYEQYFAIAKRVAFGVEELPRRIAGKMKVFKNLL